jgi:cell division protein FtsB
MKTFEKREDPILLMKRRIIILVLVILALVLGRAVYGVIHKQDESAQLRAEAERELSDLKQRETDIRTGIAEIASERGVEKALRSEYELARDGESVIVIVDDSEEAKPAPKSAPETRSWSWFW